MTLIQKAAVLTFSGCLVLIAATSGYWTHRPHSYSKCESLAAAVPVHRNKPVSKPQLAHDAEFVEDLGIRYADARFGPRSGHFESMKDYVRKRDLCTAQLFHVVSQNDGVTDDAVRASLTHRPMELDVAIILSFVIVYSWAVNAIARRIWHMHGHDYGSSHAKFISVYAALLLGLAFIMAGGGWFDTMEGIRIGNGHGSYRRGCCPWTHHYYLQYFAGAAIFCAASIFHRRAAAGEGLSSETTS